jgi:hypothetical protein
MENLMNEQWNDKAFLTEHVEHLTHAIDWFRTRVRATDTGHIYTTIALLEHRKRMLDNVLEEKNGS